MNTILEQIAAGRAPGLVPLTVEQYHRMIAAGILHDGDPIELIDGILVRKDRSSVGGDPMTHNPAHATCIRRLQRKLRVVEDSKYHLDSQLPVTLGTYREPEPDLAIVRGRAEDYADRHPGPLDIAALMEVSDSSLQFDRTTKQRLYASAQVPIYWIINLVDKQIEVYSDPQPRQESYAQRIDYHPGQSVVLSLAGVELTIAVDDILPA